MYYIKSILYFFRAISYRKKKLYKISQIKGKSKRVFIFGNGPSFSKDFERIKNKTSNTDIFALNFFASTELFVEAKPRYYALIDPEYYKSHRLESVDNLLNSLITKTSWEMFLFMPFEAHGIEQIISQNKNIVPIYFNKLKAIGPALTTQYLYKNGLAVPTGTNVLVPSLMHCINLNYREIYLFGIDHSWIKNLQIGFDNNLIMNDDHFYAKNKRNLTIEKTKVYNQVINLKLLLESYQILRKFASKNEISVYNCSDETLIDSFIRLNPKNIRP
jgi:hypothetical protein